MENRAIMFTGLIETVATVTHIAHGDRSLVIGLRPDMSSFDCKIGDSVAVDGVCLTIEKITGNQLSFRAVLESIQRSTLSHLRVSSRVNIERALCVGGRFDGHIVQGHVDAVAQIGSIDRAGDAMLYTIVPPRKYLRYIVEKGSVAIDGISLTVASLLSDRFTLSVIPHTFEQTTLVRKRSGEQVNMECDVFARYIERLISFERGTSVQSSSLFDALERSGF